MINTNTERASNMKMMTEEELLAARANEQPSVHATSFRAELNSAGAFAPSEAFTFVIGGDEIKPKASVPGDTGAMVVAAVVSAPKRKEPAPKKTQAAKPAAAKKKRARASADEAEAEEPSQYEKDRKARIESNENVLMQLGLKV